MALDCFASLAMTMWRHHASPLATFFLQCDALCDCPTGKSPRFYKNLSSHRSKNKSLRDDPKSNLQLSPSRSHMRGASRSSRTLEAGCDGRENAQRACRVDESILAYGEIVRSRSPDAAGLSHMEFWSLFQCFGSHRFACPNDAQGIGSRTKQNRSGNGCCMCPTGLGWKRSMHRAVFPYAIPLPDAGIKPRVTNVRRRWPESPAHRGDHV